jgi:hypothetical protein
VIVVCPVAAGAVAHVIGSGDGGVVSGAQVVAANVLDQPVIFGVGALSRA